MTHRHSERFLTDNDRRLLLAFDDRMGLLPPEYSIDCREKLLCHCTIMAEPEGHSLGDAIDNLEDKAEQPAKEGRITGGQSETISTTVHKPPVLDST